MNNNKSTQALLISGLIAAVIVGIGEYMLHFIPEGPEGEISMLFTVPLERAAIGHFIAVAGIPLYFSGYFGLMLQRSMNTPDFEFYLASYEDHVQVLVWALRVAVAFVSVIYIALILMNKDGLPKWLVAFNPIIILGLVISTVFWIKPVGIHAAPIAMNVTHFIFFGIILFQSKKQQINS